MESAELAIAEGQSPPRPFSYLRPDFSMGKEVVLLARTDRMMAAVQVLMDGGENNLHSHPHQDGFWMVLRGRARFYGEDNQLIAELAQHEGILVPRGARYWFETASSEPLELLQVEAFNKPLKEPREISEDRVDHEPRKVNPGGVAVHDARWRA